MLLTRMIWFFVCFSFNLLTFAQNDIVFVDAKQDLSDKKISHNLNSIQKVDSIAETHGTAQMFARFYQLTMDKIALQIKNSDISTQAFVKKFEMHFADYFLNAFYNKQNEKLASTSEWNTFFSHPNLKQWQSILLGVNVHVNIDISKTMIEHFSCEEVKAHKTDLLKLQLSVAKVYDSFYCHAASENNYFRFINSFTLGFAKFAGERWLYKWRKRNVKLGILYFEDPAKYQRLLRRVRKKKERIDRLILKQRKFLV